MGSICLTPQISLLITSARVASDLLAWVRQVAEEAEKDICISLSAWWSRVHGALFSMQVLMGAQRSCAWCPQRPPNKLSALAWVLLPQGTFWRWGVPSCSPAALTSSLLQHHGPVGAVCWLGGRLGLVPHGTGRAGRRLPVPKQF